MSFRQTGIDVDKVLPLANETLKSAVKYIQEQTNIRLVILPSTKPDFTSQNYAMKTISPIAGLEADSKAVMVFFEPGDGTGSCVNYTLEGVLEKYTPRDKKGYAEIFLPIGTVYNNIFIPKFTSLDEVTLGTTTPIRTCAILGTDSRKYFYLDHYIKNNELFAVDIMRLTFLQKTFGNPHAIRFNEEHAPRHSESIIQIGAFIALAEQNECTEKIMLSALGDHQHYISLRDRVEL